MIRSLDEMPALVRGLLSDVETEVVEYKEAKQSFDFESIGKYFSALSNEANLRNAECGWLLFGITNKRRVCGTAYRKEASRPSVGLRNLKQEIARHLNEGLIFEEIYEFDLEGKRVVVFQVPPCGFATPTTWRGVPWSRENEALKEMPRFKLEAIWGQSRPDWSKQIAFEAEYDDLDPDAVEFACERFVKKYGASQPAIRQLSHEEMLRKMGLLIHGRVTNAALVLLGRPESTAFLGGSAPRITWTLYSSDGRPEAYEHFDPPFILQVDKVLGKVRNERYRYFNSETTLFPTLANKYDPEAIRELLHNAVAHQDYRQTGKVNVLEYEDRIVFINEGSFIPGTIEKAIELGYRPPYYRNRLLSDAMAKTDMIDQNAIGIRNVYEIQRGRMLPLPTYDLSDPGRVTVTLYGKVLSEAYTRLLAAEPGMDFDTVFLLDLVQKGKPVTKEQGRALRSRGLVEGRYPNLIISSRVAGIIGTHEEYVRQKGLDTSICKELIVKLLRARPCSRAEIAAAIDHALPDGMSDDQKKKHVSYLLQELRKDQRVRPEGSRGSAVWVLN
ncbi:MULTISPECIES: RNA-binding domain-containing protein [unclassified Adlercreutzia]|uniref:RNA-binding domain-containing protein n=1 Tax=unclassified Adlercreutzia TaxID=2636013 RepID=UPI0013EE3173|nr:MULTISPECIES: RNA-binding domain-containing protein [unclassified Adlercreutzia]